MSELLNQKSSIKGKVPSGYLNAIFGLSGDWFRDTADSRYLAFDGYFISLYYLHLTASPLTLKDEVKKSVPPRWDPASLSSNSGTSQNGKVVNLFGTEGVSFSRRFIRTYGTHIIIGMAVGGQDLICVPQKPSSPIPPAECKDGLTIICTKRGGDVFTNSLSNWLQTVTARPEAILFRFAPITSLLTGIPGSGYLSHAVNLYRRCKCSYD
ncbi:MACPF domain-containing protein At4g24290-like [Populus nigra]|uniref:MACPF domain-containing protein At4g24290-like n=1 Tax=Populus nigra TaxID=3691 RepID=UPI002B2650BE|nr:MACPF domain-containing protein At4g24290-like [Populus nigra]